MSVKLEKITLADGRTVMVETIQGDGREYPMTDWHDPKKHPPTTGVSSSYVPEEYPKAMYNSYSTYVEAQNEEEEQKLLADHYSPNFTDFEAPAVATVDRVSQLETQLALMQQVVLKQVSNPFTAPAPAPPAPTGGFVSPARA